MVKFNLIKPAKELKDVSINNYTSMLPSIPSSVVSGMGTFSSGLSTAFGIAGKAYGYYIIYSIFEAAMSDILCLKTYRHGTDPYAFTCIHLTGPNPKLGGTTGGEARYYQDQGIKSPYAERDKDTFYVVEDYIDTAENIPLSYINTKFTGKYYSLRSSVSYFGSWLPLPRSWKAHLIPGAVEVLEATAELKIFGFLCPTIKFHIDPKQVSMQNNRNNLNPEQISFCRDDNDSYHNGNFEGALATKYTFSVLDIGICGVIKNGINRDLPSRMWEHKLQVLWGVAQLVVGIALIAFAFSSVMPYGTVVEEMANNYASFIEVAGEMAANYFTFIEDAYELGQVIALLPMLPIVAYAALQA